MATRYSMATALGRLYQTLWGKLALLVAAVAVLTIVGGLIATYAFGEFESYAEGAWWAFVHLLEPGAALEDETWELRVLGAILVVCGVVLLLGILFEVLAQVVDRSLSRLDETGASVALSGHVVVDGWRWSLPDVVEEMAVVVADPVDRVVIVAPTDLYEDRLAIRSAIRRRGSPRVDLLFGDPSDADRFHRASAQRARSIVAVRSEERVHDVMAVDLDVIKRAVALGRFLDGSSAGRPAVFYELARARNADAAADLVPDDFEAIVGDRMASAILKLSVLEPNWARIMVELLGEVSGLRITEGAEWAGRSLRSADHEIDGLAVATLSVNGAVDLDPDRAIRSGDRIVTLRWGHPGPAVGSAADIVAAAPAPREISIAVVGWNRKVSTLIAELLAMGDVRFTIRSIAPLPEDTRVGALRADGVDPTAVSLTRVPADDIDALQRALAEQPTDAVIVTSTIASPGGYEALQAADAAAVFNLVGITQMPRPPHLVLADLFLPDSAGPIGQAPGDDASSATNAGLARVVPIAAIQSRILARLLEQPELDPVLDALIANDQRRPVEIAVARGTPTSFADARRQLWAPDRSIVGAVVDGRPLLAPPGDTTIEAGSTLLAFTR